MSTNDIAALTPQEIAALKAATLAGMGTAQIAALTTAQIHAFTTAEIHALTTPQIQAMSSQQLGALPALTPIVLDLNDNGIDTLAASAGVQFDLRADGKPVNTGWVGGGDGLLAMDRNGNGVIDDGSELFGSSTVLANGHKAGNGYQALQDIDSNHDGVIDSRDASFDKLKVWIDGNADGVSQADELKTLAQLHIQQLQLKVAAGGQNKDGNIVGLTSSYTTTDGATHQAADVWFAGGSGAPAGQPPAAASVSAMAQAMSSYYAAAPLSHPAIGAEQQDGKQPAPALAAAADNSDAHKFGALRAQHGDALLVAKR
nr:hypothetical protein [Duganella rivi]